MTGICRAARILAVVAALVAGDRSDLVEIRADAARSSCCSSGLLTGTLTGRRKALSQGLLAPVSFDRGPDQDRDERMTGGSTARAAISSDSGGVNRRFTCLRAVVIGRTASGDCRVAVSR